MKALVAFVGAVATCASPPNSACSPTATRCEGTQAQVCTPERSWASIVECATIEPGRWRCVADGLATCTPVDASE